MADVSDFTAFGAVMFRCQGCGDWLGSADVDPVRLSHPRVDVETYIESGHDCDGTEAECQRRCPVPIPAQRQIQVECGPVQMMMGNDLSGDST